MTQIRGRPTLWLRCRSRRSTVAAHLRHLALRFRADAWEVVEGDRLADAPSGPLAVVDDPWVEPLPALAHHLAAAPAGGRPAWRVPRVFGLAGAQAWRPRYPPQTLLDYERQSLAGRPRAARRADEALWPGFAVAAAGEARPLLAAGWPPPQQRLALVPSARLYRYADPAGHERRELDRFVPDGAQLLLDVGCGSGRFGERHRRPGRWVVGIEPDWELARAARRRLDLVLALTAEAGLPLLRRPADAIVFADVLEHLADPAAVLLLARQALAPGGRIIASLPNCAFAPVLRALAAGRWDPTLAGVQARDHWVAMTPESFARLARGCGLQVEQTVLLRNPLPFAVRLWGRLAAWSAGGAARTTEASQWVATLAKI
jgi:SAM-dependent methyltransferase